MSTSHKDPIKYTKPQMRHLSATQRDYKRKKMSSVKCVYDNLGL